MGRNLFEVDRVLRRFSQGSSRARNPGLEGAIPSGLESPLVGFTGCFWHCRPTACFISVWNSTSALFGIEGIGSEMSRAFSAPDEIGGPWTQGDALGWYERRRWRQANSISTGVGRMWPRSFNVPAGRCG